MQITNEFVQKGDPGPGTGEYFSILKRTGLSKEAQSNTPLPKGLHPKKVAPVSSSKVEVGTFVVKLEKRKQGCSVKLYENMPGWRQTLRGSWDSDDTSACEKKKDDVVLAIRQIKAEGHGVEIPAEKRVHLPKLLADVPPTRSFEPAERRSVELPQGPEEYDIVINGIIQDMLPMPLKSAGGKAMGMSTMIKDQILVERHRGSNKPSGIIAESYQRGRLIKAAPVIQRVPAPPIPQSGRNEFELREENSRLAAEYNARMAQREAEALAKKLSREQRTAKEREALVEKVSALSTQALFADLIKNTPGLTEEQRKKLLADSKGL